MNLPGFTAEAVFHKSVSNYWLNEQPRQGTIVPAIPFCGNCPDILEHCAETGGKPRAVCRACETGNCFSGVERPPQLLDPFGHHPGLF
jgi:hypothetical protein